jgi:hypothetical protein
MVTLVSGQPGVSSDGHASLLIPIPTTASPSPKLASRTARAIGRAQEPDREDLRKPDDPDQRLLRIRPTLDGGWMAPTA